MKRPAVILAAGLWLIAVLGLGALNLAAPAARAETIPAPVIVPPHNTAEWTIGAITFESDYPNGFRFQIAASSTGGEIVSARAEWYHRPDTRPRQPLTVRRVTGVIDPDTGIITATWTPTGSTSVPPWVGVEYHWRLRDAAGNEFVTDPAYAEYEDRTRRWTRTESDEVLVFATGLPDNIGQMVVDAMAQQRQKYLDGWGQVLPYRPRVILFGDFTSWLEWQIGHQDTSGLGLVAVGLTSDVWGGTVQVQFGPATNLAYSTVLHEVQHLYQQEFLAARNVFTPGWFIEGNATFYQIEDMSYAVNYVRRIVNEGRLPNLLQGNGPTTGGANALDGYYIGYMFFVYLDEQWGMDAHRELMDLLAQNVPFLDALEQVTGMSADQLERKWRTWLGASPDAPTLIPTWTPVFPVISTPVP